MIELAGKEPQYLNVYDRSDNWQGSQEHDENSFNDELSDTLPDSLFVFRQDFTSDSELQWYRTRLDEVKNASLYFNTVVKLQRIGFYVGAELIDIYMPSLFLAQNHASKPFEWNVCHTVIPGTHPLFKNWQDALNESSGVDFTQNNGEYSGLHIFEEKLKKANLSDVSITLSECRLAITEHDNGDYIATMSITGSFGIRHEDTSDSFPICYAEIELFLN